LLGIRFNNVLIWILTEAKEFSYLLNVGFVRNGNVVEVALLLFRLFRQDVAMVGMAANHFSCSG